MTLMLHYNQKGSRDMRSPRKETEAALMTEFTKYQHIERLGNSEVQGILNGVVYVYPKLDGTNAQIWTNDGLVHHFGSRRRELTLDNDNAGFMTTLLGPPRTTNDRYLLDMVLGYPGCRFHGEWLIPRSLKTYTEDAWKRFYLFDITRYNPATERVEHVHYEALKDICDQYGFTDYIAPLRILVNPTVADCHKCLKENNYMIQDGAGVGEGVVLKNYAYWSKYGRQTWAKIVTSEFKDKNRKKMGASVSKCRKLGEDKLANRLTCAMVDKVVANIEAECDGWSSKYIPRLIETVWRDFVTEELYNGLKKLKQHEQTVNFRTLRGFVNQKIRELKPELC